MPLIRFLKSLFLPPSGCLLMAMVGLALMVSGRIDRGLPWAIGGVVATTLFSLPIVGRGLMALLDRYPPIPAEGSLETSPVADAQALVVLDGGGRQGAREYGGATVKNQTLERLRYGAFLAERTGLPVMVSGNGVGRRMGEVLTSAFGTPVRWLEQESRNTWENATAAAAILHPQEVRRVVLVTHFWHMPRAARAFRGCGFRVVPAPMGFRGGARGPLGALFAWLPGIAPLEDSYLFLHEIVGLFWYRVRYRL